MKAILILARQTDTGVEGGVTGPVEKNLVLDCLMVAYVKIWRTFSGFLGRRKEFHNRHYSRRGPDNTE
ncbi:hypothetical protein F441_00546 [Phytophthora nicotianae CJ01A1]|uniref:Uncharacterized protein n=3 Tax=Phytophthora nicotianae TaxID=4792 RepID=W2RFG8_PHYN3|nr:hypothetical protein PPTG_20739 [Phytophthora nicotianae INRA-310]ETK96849.1 hypothetical protein L915_00523 [Phytophthora nicotianae]ETL50194.1 hypothetical protein L916_00528 [Phytophthora nicotianae]ETN23986.1 hypothetical protein PPTG_20739 [Phytophthora nicotianae INRA-310]ETP26869.1 hypothetical protein F441_00546 [Phytophthora nicotianae CJ01A1]